MPNQGHCAQMPAAGSRGAAVRQDGGASGEAAQAAGGGNGCKSVQVNSPYGLLGEIHPPEKSPEKAPPVPSEGVDVKSPFPFKRKNNKGGKGEGGVELLQTHIGC